MAGVHDEIEQVLTGPGRTEPGQIDVVGVAVRHEGRLLAARRTAPAHAAGRWELPGGKVEPGERVEAAAVREVAEELGCRVRVTGLPDLRVPIAAGLVLRVALAELVEGQPVPHEHDAVWWLGPDELDRVDWLEPDRPFLPLLREHLGVPDPDSSAVAPRRNGSEVRTNRGGVRA